MRAAEQRVWRDGQDRQRAAAEVKAVADEMHAQRGTGLDPARVSPKHAQRRKQARRAAAKTKARTGETAVAQTREDTVAEPKTGIGETPCPAHPSL